METKFEFVEAQINGKFIFFGVDKTPDNNGMYTAECMDIKDGIPINLNEPPWDKRYSATIMASSKTKEGAIKEVIYKLNRLDQLREEFVKYLAEKKNEQVPLEIANKLKNKGFYWSSTPTWGQVEDWLKERGISINIRPGYSVGLNIWDCVAEVEKYICQTSTDSKYMSIDDAAENYFNSRSQSDPVIQPLTMANGSFEYEHLARQVAITRIINQEGIVYDKKT